MVTFIVNRTVGNVMKCQANGWGKSFNANCSTAAKLDQWKQFATSRIVFDKLKGFIENRRIAYKMKQYKDPFKLKCIEHLQFYFHSTQGKTVEQIYKLVNVNKHRFVAIMPSKDNKLKFDIEEILIFCNHQMNK